MEQILSEIEIEKVEIKDRHQMEEDNMENIKDKTVGLEKITEEEYRKTQELANLEWDLDNNETPMDSLSSASSSGDPENGRDKEAEEEKQEEENSQAQSSYVGAAVSAVGSKVASGAARAGTYLKSFWK